MGCLALTPTEPVSSGCPRGDPKLVLVHSRFQGQTSPSKHCGMMIDLGCPLACNGPGSGVPATPGGCSQACGELPLGRNGRCSLGGRGNSVSMTGPDDLPGETTGRVRGPCAFPVSRTIAQQGGACGMVVSVTWMTWLLARITQK